MNRGIGMCGMILCGYHKANIFSSFFLSHPWLKTDKQGEKIKMSGNKIIGNKCVTC